MADPAQLISSTSQGQGGTIRWMGPELLMPQQFGFDKCRLTEASDCYALGMVIYETISGKVPFHECMEVVVFARVVLGEHPSRCAAFPEDVWETMKLCWTSRPHDRPGIADILRRLGAASNSSKSPSPGYDDEMDVDSDYQGPLDHFPTSDTIMAEWSTPEPVFTPNGAVNPPDTTIGIPIKKKIKRANAEQLGILKEVYDRTPFPSSEEVQELAVKLNMTPRMVQIWYVSRFSHH